MDRVLGETLKEKVKMRTYSKILERQKPEHCLVKTHDSYKLSKEHGPILES